MTFRASCIRLLVIPALAAIVSAGGGSRVSAGTISFQFNPPSGVQFVVSSKMVRNMTARKPGDSKVLGTRVNVEASKTRTSIKKTAKGYMVTETILSYKVTEDGKPLPNPAVDALIGLPLCYDVASDGTFVGIRDLDGLLKHAEASLKKSLPEDAVKMIMEMLTKTIEPQTKGRWLSVMDGAGKSLTVGTAWQGAGRFPVPVGPALPFVTERKLTGRVKDGGKSCARVAFTYRSDKESCRKAFDEWLAKVGENPDMPSRAPKLVEATISGSGERIQDPATMLMHAIRTHRVASTTIDVPDEGVKQIIVDEKNEVGYSYSK